MIEVSVIITTKNEENNIKNCLESIKKQDYFDDKIEIIVVDNNSSDKTREKARAFTDKIYIYGPERSAQRNFGISKAEGKYVLYLDADMALSGSLISECVAKSEREDFIALYIPERIVGGGFWVKVRDFERSFYNATVIDAVRFVRREKVLEVGGFDLNLTGPEDWDFDRRIKSTGRVSATELPLFHNEGKIDLAKYIRKKAYYSGSFKEYINKWGKNDPVIKKQFGAYYRLIGVFTENGKWKVLLKHPVLAIAMYSLRFLVGIFVIKGFSSKERKINEK